jgi:ribonuclease P protein component
VRAHACAVPGRYFTVRARSSELPTARLGIIAPRAAIRRAVDRNTSKRIARELFREHKEALRGLDVVVVCRVAVSGNVRVDARRELARLLMAVSENRNPRATSTNGANELQ